MRVTIDARRCQSTGFCVRVAPQLFQQRGDGPTVVLDPTPPPALHDAAQEAEGLCPVAAIRVERDDGRAGMRTEA